MVTATHGHIATVKTHRTEDRPAGNASGTAWLRLAVTYVGIAAGACVDSDSGFRAEDARDVRGLSTCAVRIGGYHHLAALLPYEGIWPVGESMQNAISQAVLEINDGGGIRGESLGLVLCNTKGDPGTAASVMDELLGAERVVAAIGAVASATTLAAANRSVGQMVLISPGAMADELADVSTDGWFYRTIPSARVQGMVASRIAQSLGFNRVFVVSAPEPEGVSMRRGFVEDFTGAGWPADSYTYDPTKQNYPRAAVDNVTAYGPQAVVLAGFHQDSAAILRTAFDRGFRPQRWLLAAPARHQDVLDAVANDAYLEGAIGIGPASTRYPEYDAFASRFAKRWAESASPLAAGAYDAAYLLALAMALAADPSDRNQVKQQLGSVDHGTALHAGDWAAMLQAVAAGAVDYRGAAGPQDFDSTGSTAANIDAWNITSGTIVTQGCWTPEGKPCP